METFTATISPNVDDTGSACAFSTDGGYDVAETTSKHRKPAIRQRYGEDQILDRQKRSRAIGTSRETMRNFAVASWAVRKHLDYVCEFDLQVRTDDRAFNDDVEQMVAEWMRPANCDVAGLHHFPRMLRIAETRRVVDGDVGLLKVRGAKLQGIESDLIKNPPEIQRPGQRRDASRRDAVRWDHGVKKNGAGRHVAYSLWRREGKGYQFAKTVGASQLLLHGFFDYFSQSRGISPIAAGINTLSDVKTGFELALVKAKVSQLIGLIFKRSSGTGFGAQDSNGEYVVDFGNGPCVLDLDEGDDAEFISPNTPASEFQEFVQLSIAVALKSLDIPFSFYDESFTNFFGSRAAWQHYERSCVSKRRDVAELLRRIAVWLFAEWIIARKLTLPRGMTLATLPFEWVPRGMPWWKPDSEIRADIEAVKAGFSTPQRICRERGRGDYFDNVDKIKQAAEYADEQGVPLSWALGPVGQDSAADSRDGRELSDRIEGLILELQEKGLIDA